MNTSILVEKIDYIISNVIELLQTMTQGKVEFLIAQEFLHQVVDTGGLIKSTECQWSKANKRKLDKALVSLNKAMYSLNMLDQMTAINRSNYNSFYTMYEELADLLTLKINEEESF